MAVVRDDDFLRRYRSELAYLRRQGADFARTYPRIAKRLELSTEGLGVCPDPHIERLIESFAFLTARIQRNLEAELPEVTTALLGMLYPHFVQPVPSMAIARFDPDPEGGGFAPGEVIPKHTKLFVESMNLRRPCRFRTCYPVRVWPIEISGARFEGVNRYPFLSHKSFAAVTSVMRITLTSKGGPLSAMGLDRLRLYLADDIAQASDLYDLLNAQVHDVVAVPGGGTEPQLPALGADALVPVGFGPDEAVLPSPRESLPAYRLLQEYFAFPEKFLFLDIERLDTIAFDEAHETLDLLFLLKEPPRALAVHTDSFALGCTPIANLFYKVSEPIQINHERSEYMVIPDARWERTTEVHSIQSVSSSLQRDDHTTRIQALFAFQHSGATEGPEIFWHARRRPSRLPELPGSDVWISFVDADLSTQLPPYETARAHLLCTNRDLATHIDRGDALNIEDGPFAPVRCITKPTEPLTPPLAGDSLWRLVSHMSLSHLSLPDGEAATEALREQLRLYQYFTSTAVEHQIIGINQVSRTTVALRAADDAWRGFCRVQRITVKIDENHFVGSSAIMLGHVLNHYFGLHSSINVFTQLVMESAQRGGHWKTWPAMIPKVELHT